MIHLLKVDDFTLLKFSNIDEVMQHITDVEDEGGNGYVYDEIEQMKSDLVNEGECQGMFEWTTNVIECCEAHIISLQEIISDVRSSSKLESKQ
jgi:hypothetical protein